MAASARQLYEQGRAALAEQHPAQARALLERAAGLCADDELALRIAISSAWVRFEEEGPAPALAELATAAARAGDLALPHLAAAAAVQVGIVHARSGDLDAARCVLDEVDAQALPIDDRARMLLNRGTIASQLHRFDDAARDLASAADLAEAHGAAQLAFMSRHNLGWVQFLRGDLPAALREMHDADALDVDLDRSVARLDLARVLLEAGLPTDAHELLRLARQGQSGAHQIAEIDLDLARSALLMGRAEEALAHARRAITAFCDRDEPAWLRRARLAELQAEPRPDRARSLLADALAAGDRVVAGQAAAVGLMAGPDGADPSDLEAQARRLAESPVLSLRLAGLVALATSACRSGDVAAARGLLRRASVSLLRAQLGFASLDLRTAAALHGEQAAELDARLADGLGPEAIVETSEHWRAATRTAPRLHPSSDPRIAAAATDLRRRRVEHDPGSPRAAESSLGILAAERELRSLTWGAGLPLPPSVVTLPMGSLEDAARRHHAVLVVTVLHRDEFIGVVLGDGEPRRVRLGGAQEVMGSLTGVHADLTANANVGPGHPVAGPVRASLAAGLDRLGALLAAPLADLPGGLVVVPTRGLSSVPWSALPPLRGRAVTVSPTASSWASASAVVVAPRVSVHCGPGVPHATEEAAAVSRAWRPTGTAGLLDALAHDDLVHVVAHGQHRGDNPLFSSLLLEDGPLFAHELEGAEIRASQVVLSACEVGRATQRPVDQPLGLTATLLAAGVTTVIAPVAPIGDRLAAEVMGRYHAELAAGSDAATALARASLADPGAGAFVCFGSPWRAVGR